jgi:AcrR family transcriptional regulator
MSPLAYDPTMDGSTGLSRREPPEPGLRERKKEATRQALHEAALRLAMAHGLEAVTVEGIADAAGVSRRTFSNYFSSKEDALLHGDRSRMRLLLDTLRNRPPEESGWTALVNSAEELYRGNWDPEWVAQARLVRRHPSLVAQQVALYAMEEREIAAEIAARSPSSDSPPMRHRLMAAAFLASLRVAVDAWLDQPPGTSLIGLVRRALDEVSTRFD